MEEFHDLDCEVLAVSTQKAYIRSVAETTRILQALQACANTI